jgi:hypothetical protein
MPYKISFDFLPFLLLVLYALRVVVCVGESEGVVDRTNMFAGSHPFAPSSA